MMTLINNYITVWYIYKKKENKINDTQEKNGDKKIQIKTHVNIQ